jgi:hypothetical protein
MPRHVFHEAVFELIGALLADFHAIPLPSSL